MPAPIIVPPADTPKPTPASGEESNPADKAEKTAKKNESKPSPSPKPVQKTVKKEEPKPAPSPKTNPLVGGWEGLMHTEGQDGTSLRVPANFIFEVSGDHIKGYYKYLGNDDAADFSYTRNGNTISWGKAGAGFSEVDKLTLKPDGSARYEQTANYAGEKAHAWADLHRR